MLILASTADKLNLVTSSAANTDVQVSYADFAAGVVTLSRKNTAIAAAATNDITGSPAASTQRNIKHISVRNKHASTSQTVTFQHTDGATVVELFSCILLAGQQMVYDGEQGFRVYSGGSQRIFFPASVCAITDDNSTSVTMYPVWVTANTGNLPLKVSSTKLSFNPSSGTLTAAGNMVSAGFIGASITSSSSSYNQPNFFNPVLGDTNWAFGIMNSGSDYWMQAKYAEAGDNLRGFRVLDINSGLPVFSVNVGRAYVYGGIAVGAALLPGAGNIGLMAIPSSALSTTVSGLLIANSGLYASNSINTGNSLYFAHNIILTSGGVWKYVSTEAASLHVQSGGSHSFYSIASGSAGATATVANANLVVGPNSVAANVPIVHKTYTVGALPSGTLGYRAIVSDATGPTFGATVVGGGAVKVPVFHDGTNWKVG